MTSEVSPQQTQQNGQLTSSAAGSHASISHSLGREQELSAMKMAADSGLKCTGSFAFFDQDSSSWKTLQTSLFGGLMEYSEIWPRAGMTLLGNACRVPPWVPDIREIDSLPWVWIGTPTAAMSVRSKRFQRRGGRSTPGELAKLAGGVPNPEWIESLMGFPIGWTDVEGSEMRSCHKSQSGSADA